MRKITALLLTALMVLSMMSITAFAEDDLATVRLGGLKGPTSMGMAKLLKDNQNGETENNYEFTIKTGVDGLVPAFTTGEADIVSVPANLAALLYSKTKGTENAAQLLAVNTLGVMYVVENGDSVKSLEDLKGKTIYSIGKGSVPEYVLKYLLAQNGIDEAEIKVEWKADSSEIVAIMAADQSADTIAVLPQPFVTIAQTKVPGLNVAINLDDEWNKLDNGSSIITGVVIARKSYVENNKETVDKFLKEYQASIEFANENNEEAAKYIEEFDIFAAAIAQKSLPACNLAFISGAEMQEKTAGYLQILFDSNPESVGGAVPGDDFYYVEE